tara:strand:+ start:8872 stop:9099 length:228 start_codon:yes stop_codon:yes gene_type:complete
MSLRPQPVDAFERGRFRVKSQQDLDHERIEKLEEKVDSLRLMVLRLVAKVDQIDTIVKGGVDGISGAHATLSGDT